MMERWMPMRPHGGDRMPVLVSVPHAGCAVPERWREACVLGLRGLREDADEQAREVFDVAGHVADFVTTETARAIVDLNRPPNDLGPDGVVKTETCWKAPVWKRPLRDDEKKRLLDEHYFPYHDRLSAPRGDVRCGLDLHTMAATAPPIAPRPGEPRPIACISSADGTAPQAWVDSLADAFEAVLPERPRINDPFQGGHITRFHAAEMPWIQVELNRGDFMTVEQKRQAVLAALRAFCDVVLEDAPRGTAMRRPSRPPGGARPMREARPDEAHRMR